MKRAALLKKRARILREAEALRTDGEFANDQARADFDAKMAEIEAIDEELRALDVDEEPQPAPAADADAIRAAERKRGEDIRRAVRAAHRARPDAGFDERYADELVAAGGTADQARAQILEKLEAAQGTTPTDSANRTITVGEEEAAKWSRGAEAWLFQKAGVADVVRAAAEKRKDHPAFAGVSFDPAEFRGLTLVELCRMSLERRGVSTRGMSKMDMVAKMFALRSSGVMGAQTTSDFTVALENVMHKTMLAAYTVTPDTWRLFAATGSVTDFRAHNRYRTGYLGRLDKVLEAGEFKNKALPDALKESITAETFGNILALTRQAIVNDDMGMFNRASMQAGRAAKLSIELDVYATLALNGGLGPVMSDTKTLFHADHGNIVTGAALSAAAIDADRVVLAQQTDPSGNEILDLRPEVLLLPIGLGGSARAINGAEFDFEQSNKFMKPNTVRGLFRTIVDTPRISGTRRYLFADPATMPVLEVAFLEGQEEPFLEMQDGWRIDGVEWKVRLDYGVAGIETRGAVTNAGA